MSRTVLSDRLRVFWLYILTVRLFFAKAFGVVPVQELDDQKRVHYNEAGSKSSKTLELPHRARIPLKENHAQTRACLVDDALHE